MSEVRRVCVTGAGGFLASWLVKFLLAKGYAVHGTVRNPSDQKNSHLMQLEKATERLKIFKADLFDYEGLFAAIEGCHGVFHVASPVPFDVSQCRKEDITEPAVVGTRNVINASSEVKVKKVVIVSSIGAVAFTPHWPKDQIMDEECWSDVEFCEANKFWYFLSKTAAEKEAWEMSKRNETKIVTVCPSIVIGPLLQPTRNSSSLYLLTFFQDHGDEPASNESRAFVDVRDTAESLLLVYENAEADGRYICSSHHTMTLDFVNMLQKMYPHYDYPKRFQEEEETTLTLKFTSKKLQDLGWRYRPFEETIMDTVKSYEEIGALQVRNTHVQV